MKLGGLVIKAKVFNRKNFVENSALVLGQRAVNKHGSPLTVSGADVEALQSTAHREQIWAEGRVVRFAAQVQRLYLYLEVVDSASEHVFEHASL